MFTCGPTYCFTMKDSYRDSIYYILEEGYYNLTVEGSVIKNGGEFSKEESTEFSSVYLQSPFVPVLSSTSLSVALIVLLTPSLTEVLPIPVPTEVLPTLVPTEVLPKQAPT